MPIADLEPVAAAIPTEEIDAQLAKMLESHHFCHSQRYPALLRYLVEQWEQGNAGLLKERLLGVEVFHRAPDYDTNTDPVVRVTAAEVRKRIAQYYQEPEHSSELRIDLPTGSYLPRFFRMPPARGKPEPESAAMSLEHAVAGETVLEPAVEGIGAGVSSSGGLFLLSRWLPIGAAALLGALIAIGGMKIAAGLQLWQERALTEFWAPFASSNGPVLVVVGNHKVGSEGNALRSSQGVAASPSDDVLKMMNDYDQVTLSDVTSLAKITTYLMHRDQSYRLLGAGTAEIADMRSGPVLLFAGLDNRWTMRLTEHLRYRFVDSPDDSIGTIEDSRTPGRSWQVDFKVPYANMPMDYAIAARYYDPLVEQPVMVVAGLGATGTVAASEFVTSQRFLEGMNALAPKDWSRKNVEVVLALPVIDGHAGPPHIVASQFW